MLGVKAIKDMCVADLIEVKPKFEIFSMSPERSVLDAAKFLAEKNIGILLVIQAGDLCGVLSERDIIKRSVAKEANASDQKIQDVMTASVLTIEKSESLRNAMELMKKNRCRHLVIKDGGSVFGVISERDISHSVLNELLYEEVNQALED